MRKALLTLLVCVIAPAVFACGSDKPAAKASNTAVQVCAPGTSYSCVAGGCNGHQACFSDGSMLTACVCDPEGQAGSGGTPADAGPGTALDASDTTTTDAGPTAPVPSPKSTCHGKEQCVSAATDGFAGPVALYVGSATPPKCDGAFALKVLSAGADPAGDPATCSSCTCTPASGACPAFLDFSTSASCGATACTTSVSASCVEISTPCVTGVSTASLTTKLPSAPTKCKASKQVASKTDAGFGKDVIACALSAAQRLDCKTDEVCAPEPSTKFQAQLCVWKAGDVTCPAGDYPERHVYYRKLHDARSCSACACDGPDCTTSWQVFDTTDTTCATPVISLTSADQCVQVNPVSDKLRVGVTIGGAGTCDAKGGAPEGDVTGDDPVTVCCMH